VPRGGLGFRRFLPEGLRLTELAAPATAEDPPPPRGEMLAAIDRAPAAPVPPASPAPNAAQKIPKAQKGADPIGTFRRGARRAPNYIWRSQASRDARTSWADQLSRPF
jgi:hypothetical protein